MSKPIIGTIALMTAIAYWNNWTNGVYFIHTKENWHPELLEFGSQQHRLPAVTFRPKRKDYGTPQCQYPYGAGRLHLITLYRSCHIRFSRNPCKGITVGSVKG